MDLQSVAIQAAQQNGVPPDFFLSLIGNGENGFNDPGVSTKGAAGVTQMIPETARAMGVTDRSDPLQSINGGAKYAGQLWKKYGGDPVLTAAAYNAGPGAVDRHGGVPPYPETLAYVKRVTGGMEPQLPSPDQVLGGYGGHGAGSVPGGQGAAKDTSGGGAEPTMPSPEQIMSDYAPTGSGQVVYPTGRPVLAAQEKAVLARKQAGQWDANQPQGSDLNPYVEQPGIPAPAGAAKFDVNGNFVPASAQGAPAQAQDTSPVGLYQARVQPAMNALAADFKTAQAPPKGVLDTILNAAPLGLTPRNLKTAADAVSYITAPISAAADYVIGKPVNALSGGRIPIQTAGDVGSFAIPVAGEMREAALLDRAAEAAGMDAQGFRNATATTQNTAQALAAARRAATPRTPGPVSNALAPFAARFSENAAKAQAGQKLAANATDLPAVKASLANGPDEIVPGSTPTTFQQTGDLGLGSLERSVATKNPDLFAARRADQNTARVGVLQALQSGVDPAQLSTALRGGLEDMDRATDQAVQQAASAARGKANALGGDGTPEGYGANVRDLVQTAENGARARESTLWQAIDPNGDLTGNVGQTVEAAQKIIGDVPKTAKPMDGEEGAIFQTAAAMPQLAPVSDLVALRSRISTAMRNEIITQGRSPTYARLSQLRGAIQDNLAGSIADKIAEDDAAVQAGTIAPDAALSARLSGAVEQWRSARAGQAVGGSDLGRSGAGSARAVGPPGAEVPPTGGLGSAPGNPGVQGQPTFDPGAADRLAAATESTKARARTFGLQPVSSVTAKAGASDLYRLPDGQVPGKFFHPGPAGFQHMQALLKAAGPEALPVIEDYAAQSLKRAALKDDGTLDPGKYAAWVARHQDSIRALPAETQARFADAAKATEAVQEAMTSRAAALKQYQSGAIGRVLNVSEPEDVTRVVGQILNGKSSVQDMKALARVTQGNDDARAGLRQAIADHIAQKLIGNTEVGTSGQAGIRADQFQNFSRQSRAALSQVFTREEVDRIEAVARDIQRSKRSENAIRLPGNSNTAQDQSLIAKHGGKGVQGFIDILGAMIGGGIGHAHGAPSMVGEAVGGMTAHYLQNLRSAGVQRVDDLVTRAMLDPAVARELLAKVPTRSGGQVAPAVLDNRMRGLYAALVGSGATAPARAAPQGNALAH